MLLVEIKVKTRDRRISITGQIVAKKLCAEVKIWQSSRQLVVTMLTTAQNFLGHDAAFYQNSSQVTPPLYAVTLQKHPAVNRPSRGTSTVTPRRRAVPLQKHPAVTRHRAVTLWADVREQKSYNLCEWEADVRGRADVQGADVLPLYITPPSRYVAGE